MSGKRGGKKESAAVEEDAKVEAEAQALIQEQIDTTDVDGAFLRGLLVNLADEEEVEVAPLREKLEKIKEVGNTISSEIGQLLKEKDLEKDPKKKEEIWKRIKEKGELSNKITGERQIVEKQIEDIKIKHGIKQQEIFYIAPNAGVSINLHVSLLSKLGKHKETILKPQIEFIQKIWKPRGGAFTLDITAKGRAGGGGTSLTGEKTVMIGLNRIGTTPLHEFIHQVEEQTPGAEFKRREKAKEIILKRTGKQKLSEIEVEKKIWFVDDKGKKHYWRDSTNKEDVYVPKGVFKSEKEHIEYGYMFRVYKQDTEMINGVRVIKDTPTNFLGIEMPTKAAEHIYTEPAKFAKDNPDVFDMVIELFRGK